MGALTPMGVGVQALWSSVVAGRSGIGTIERADTSNLPVHIGGEVRDFDPKDFLDAKAARHMDRFTQFAVVASRMAMADAGLEPGSVPQGRGGVTFGTGIGGIETWCQQHEVLLTRGPDRVTPYFIPMIIANMAASHVAIDLRLDGPNQTTVTACCSSAHAVGDALNLLRRGDADVMLAGGSEAVLVPLAIAGFAAMRALSLRNDEPTRACRPFDRGRDGFVMAEGAGSLVLETLSHARARGARPLAEVCGYGMSSDAYHMVEPLPDGTGAAAAMRGALADAGLRPEAVGYINAHATSTPKGDVAETRAIRQVFGAHADRLAVSSTKSMTGHLLGAAGAVELILTVLALREGVLPPTINLEDPDPECDLDYVPNVARRQNVEAALTNSFGFGGQNVSLAVRRLE